MAVENSGTVVGNLLAEANYSSTGQYRFVAASTAAGYFTLVASSDRPRALGVLQNNPSSGQVGTIWAVGSGRTSKVKHDGTCGWGDLVQTSSDKLATSSTSANTSGTWSLGTCMTASPSTVSGTMVEVLLWGQAQYST